MRIDQIRQRAISEAVSIRQSMRYMVGKLYFFMDKNRIDISSMKDIHKGEKCFIVGNGPSLTAEDLDRIESLGVPSFAANKIYKILPKTKWRPTYISVSDPSFIYVKDTLKGIDNIGAEYLFLRDEFYFEVRNLKTKVVPVKSMASRKLLETPKFSNDLGKVIYDIATVTFFALQIAVYMGFKEIYLIGVDHKYSTTVLKTGEVIHDNTLRDHFREDEDSQKIMASSWEMDIAYDTAYKYQKKYGYTVYNATRGGCLERFQRVDLDSILNMWEKEGDKCKA